MFSCHHPYRLRVGIALAVFEIDRRVLKFIIRCVLM
jgi:hypothetical protein